MTNLTQKNQERKPFSLFEQTAELIRPEVSKAELIANEATAMGVATVMESAMTRLHSMVKPSYFIEEAKMKGEIIEVVFCLKGDERLPADEIKWEFDEIDTDALRDYVEGLGMNTFVNDYMRGGEYVQEEFTLDFDTYMEDAELREHAVAEWLRDNRGFNN